MGQVIVADDQLEDRLQSEKIARGPAITAAVQAASDMIWAALGSTPGGDLAYASGVAEKYRHRGGPMLYLRRRPVSAVTQIRYFDLDGSVVETLASSEYSLLDATKGIVTSRRFPDTRLTALVGYERRLVGRAIPTLEVTYTGGWVCRPQFLADNTLTVNVPSDIEEAALQQALYLYRSRMRDRSITNKSDEASAAGFLSFRSGYQSSGGSADGGLLPEVAAVCRRHKRVGDLLG